MTAGSPTNYMRDLLPLLVKCCTSDRLSQLYMRSSLRERLFAHSIIQRSFSSMCSKWSVLIWHYRILRSAHWLVACINSGFKTAVARTTWLPSLDTWTCHSQIPSQHVWAAILNNCASIKTCVRTKTRAIPTLSSYCTMLRQSSLCRPCAKVRAANPA